MQNSYCKLSIAYFLFLIGILLLVGYTPTNDGDGYIEYAILSINDHQPYPSISTIIGKPFIWNIGQINLIALSLWLFKRIYPLLVLMCALKALTAYIIARLTEFIFNHNTGILAILLYIIYPNNWGQSTTLLSEIPSVSLALTALYLMLKYNNVKIWIVAGLLFAIANWIRPISLIYIGSALFFCLLYQRENIIKRYTTIIAAYACITIFLGLSCWHRTGYFVTQPTTVWFNFAATTYEKSTKVVYTDDFYPKGTARYIEGREHLTAFQCADIWKKRSLKWLVNHKTEYIKKIPGRLFWMYYEDNDNLPAFLKDKSKAENNYVTLPIRYLLHDISSLSGIQCFLLLNQIVYMAILILAIISSYTLILRKQYRKAFLPLFIIIAGSLCLVLISHGETRFKSPFMPFIFMVAAAFLSSKENSDKLSTPQP
jgi:hypothetical protein